MKRLGRWLFNLAAVVSLLLSITTVVLWVRSYWCHESFGGFTDRYSVARFTSTEFWIGHDRGTIGAKFVRYVQPSQGEQPTMTGWFMREETHRDLTSAGSVLKTLGFGFQIAHHSDVISDYRVLWFSLPYWSLTGALVVIAGCCGRTRQRSKPGLCLTCGYDLRATPERCPECGTIPGGCKEATL